MNELNIIRQSLYELEAQHGKVRQQYEEELARLRSENHALRQGGGGIPSGGGHNPPIMGPASGGPPSSISAGGGVPPFNDPYFSRNDRDRDRDNVRERERNERIERDRERDAMRDRERDRAVDSRDPKRMKADRMKSERPGMFQTPNLPFVTFIRTEASHLPHVPISQTFLVLPLYPNYHHLVHLLDHRHLLALVNCLLVLAFHHQVPLTVCHYQVILLDLAPLDRHR